MQKILSKIVVDIKNKWNNVNNKKLKKAGLNWFKLRRLKYSPAPFGIHKLKGREIYFKNTDELIHSLREIFVDDVYKMKTNSPEPYIIDCGANIGLSLLYMKSQFPNSRILAFEPDETNFALLKKNTAGFTNLEINQKAVWKENASICFDNAGTLSSQIIADVSQIGKVKRVEAVRLRDYLNAPIHFLKLDIEGAEYEVLKDCTDRLQWVENLFIEYHGRFEKARELTEIFDLLYQNGFSYYIKEAANVYPTPFYRDNAEKVYDVQLNIFCFKK